MCETATEVVVMKEPLISVCIPTYNSAKHLVVMLDSVVAQTYKNMEVIISDNASTDGTLEIAKAYANKYGWHINVNEKNMGAGANFNRLLYLARGEYIAIYHADDIYEPTIVEESCCALRKHENVGIVGTLGGVIDEHGAVIGEFKVPNQMMKVIDGVYDFDTVFINVLAQRSIFLVTPSIMVRREAYQEVGKFEHRYGSAGDYEMWFRIMQKHRFCLINKKLINYRIHQGQGSYLELRENLSKPDSLLVYEEYTNRDQEKFKRFFNYAYYKLLFMLAIKLNNRGEFQESNKVLADIQRKTGRFLVTVKMLQLVNSLKIKVSLSALIRAKAVLNKVLPI